MAAHLPGVRPGTPIRLLWLIDSLVAGGAEALTVRFVRELQRAGKGSAIEPVVAFLKRLEGNPHEAELRELGVEPVFLDARHLRDLGAFRRLLALIRRQRIDVLHAHLAYASIWGAVAGRITGRPVVTTLHVTPPRARRWSREGLRQALRRRLLTWPDVHPVAVSRAVADAWERETGLSRLPVIPNGVPVGEEPRRQADSQSAPEAPRVVSVAVLRPDKGLDVLVDAAPAVLDRHPEVRFVIVGDGPARPALEARARGLGLDPPRLTFTGFRRDVAERLSAADLFVLPSREDAFPTVLLEAAAAGLPTVASAVGGIPEIVVDGESGEPTGVLVPPDDPQALAAAMNDLLARPVERRRMGRAARRRAEKRFSVERWVARLTELYRSLLPAPRAASHPPSPRPLETSIPPNLQPSKPPTLALVEPAGRGGLVHYAFQLARALAQEGAEVTLITSHTYELGDLEAPFRVERLLRLWDPKPASDRAARSGPLSGLRRRLRRVGRAFVWYREWLRLVGVLDRIRPDVIQLGDIRFAGDLLPLTWLARRASRRGSALVDLCHNVRPFALGGVAVGGFRRGRWTRAVYRRIYRRFDRVFVHFDSNRRRFLDTYGLPAERVGTIPHGNEELFRELADPSCTPAVLRRRLGLPPEAPVVLFFGSLARYKGPELLLEAFREVHRSHPEARLVFAGPPLPGLDAEELRREAERRGLAAVTRIEAEYVPAAEVAAWMELATVAAFPYRQISQSGAVALALTFGVPPVVTRVGAMAETVRDGETGRVIPPEDPEALAAAVRELLDDPEHAARLGRAAEVFAREELSWRRIARRLLADYRELTESRELPLARDSTRSRAPGPEPGEEAG